MRTSNYEYLRNKWTKRHKALQKKLIKKHRNSFEWLAQNSKQLAVGSLGSLMLLTSPVQQNSPQIQAANASPVRLDSKIFLLSDLSSVLPDTIRPLTKTEESTVSTLLSKSFGVKTAPEINGLRLNRSYGLIGAEQHLARFPGDNMATHFDGNLEEANTYRSSGMAPGLGAWGYFATSRVHLIPEDTQREKYYIAVQTFLAPDFNRRVAEYRDFFKFRKMLVVNPENGRSVVAVIGDAGPAEWTGKHLGGSPEVMKHLERVDGSLRGPVLYYFIDDPNDNIPLGPIDPV